jgi:hypothetical protein
MSWEWRAPVRKCTLRGEAHGISTGTRRGRQLDFLRWPRCEVNLCTNLDEYLRFGLEAGISFVR